MAVTGLIGLNYFRQRLVTNVSQRWASSSPLSSKLPILAQATTDGHKMTLKIEGEQEEKRYHGVWLRHNCRCPVCFPQASMASTVHPTVLAKGLEIKDTKIQDNMVYVEFETGHVAEFDLGWLIEHNYTDKDVQLKKRIATRPLVAETVPVSDYNDIVSSTEGHYEWAKQLNFYGISLLKNVPTELEIVGKLAEKIGPIQETIYGGLFDVIGKEDPVNLAYGFGDLNFHMDLLYYQSPPGLQILHCVRNDPCVEGGESIMLDSYAVVTEMRQNYPHQFNTLTKVPVTFQRHHHGHSKPCDLKFTRTHIVLDEFGEISAINWNPHGHDPMAVPEDQLEDYYEAFLLLNRLFEESKWKIIHRLQAGEAFTFNNRRVLHARNAFVLNGGLRHLRGAYVPIDYIHSTYEVLAKKLGKKELSRNILMG